MIRHSTAHLMAQAVQSALSRHAGDDRPGYRGRLLLRLRAADAVHRRGFAEDRSEDARAGEGRSQGRARPKSRAPRRSRNSRAMGEQYKVEIISGIPEDPISIYSQGDWMDLCRGPHVPSTRLHLKAFKLTSVAGAYWRGDEHNAMLSRIYGTAFASKEALEEHLKLVELARSARPSQARARDGPVHVRSDLAGLAVLPAQGRRSSSTRWSITCAGCIGATASTK